MGKIIFVLLIIQHNMTDWLGATSINKIGEVRLSDEIGGEGRDF